MKSESKKFVVWRAGGEFGYVAMVVQYMDGSVDVVTTTVEGRALAFTKRRAEELIAKLGGHGYQIYKQ